MKEQLFHPKQSVDFKLEHLNSSRSIQTQNGVSVKPTFKEDPLFDRLRKKLVKTGVRNVGTG